MDEIEQHLNDYEQQINRGEYPKQHKRYVVVDLKEREQFLQDIESDIQLFDEMATQLEQLQLLAADPKTACLIEHIRQLFDRAPQGTEPKRKVIVFSEYADTVHYLAPQLQAAFNDRVLKVSGHLGERLVKEINSNFDASYGAQCDDYDILLATDTISEGFNLNRAGMVINYDIPWNPVRVIQRLGRINRINIKVFNELYIVNFFPTAKGAELVRSREIAAQKMFIIHTTLGEDSKIFDIDESPAPAELYQRINRNPDEHESESFYTHMLKRYLAIETEHPDLIAELDSYPPRIKVAKKYHRNNLIVLFKKNRLHILVADTDAEKISAQSVPFEEVIDAIACDPDEPRMEWNTDRFWNAYHEIQRTRASAAKQNDQSIEQKAQNNIEYLLRRIPAHLLPYQAFLHDLREDIIHYGTLPQFTLRRIANLKLADSSEIAAMQTEIGRNYLARVRKGARDVKKDIIIAIENKNIENKNIENQYSE